MDEIGPENLGPDIDQETGDFIHHPEQEFSENRMERLRARIIELLESDIESVVASLSSETMEMEELFEIEIELDTIESGDQDIPLSDEELSQLHLMLQSEQALALYKENNIEYIGANFGPGHIDKKSVVFSIRLKTHFDMKEPSAEFIKIKFSNTCPYCKDAGEADPIVTLEEEVPTSLAGDWKKGKGKDKGREYRDWDYGEVECPKCAKRGTPSKIFLYYREYKE
jgi:hypothetical protein